MSGVRGVVGRWPVPTWLPLERLHRVWGPWALAVAAAVAAPSAGAHPTGTSVADPLYAALFAGVVTLASAYAARGTVVWLAVLATVFARHGAILPVAILGLVMAIGAMVPRRPWPILGAASGAMSVEVVLRWPPVSFHGATTLLAIAAVGPVLIAGLMYLPSRAQHWIEAGIFVVCLIGLGFTIALAYAGAETHTDLTRGIDAAQSALRSVSNGQATAGSRQLTEASADFTNATQQLDAWWTGGARLVPLVAQQRRAVVGSVKVARNLTGTVSQQATHIDFGLLHYAGGGVDLTELEALQQPLHVVVDQLSAGQHQLQALRSEWLVDPISSRLATFERQVARADTSASLAAEAVDGAPSMLGATATRHYLVAFVDPSESRGLGGEVVDFAELTASRGRISITKVGDVSQIDQALQAKGGGHITGMTNFLARYGSLHPERYFEDATLAPDLPTDTAVIRQLYAEAGNPAVDGVLVLDPRALGSLLSFAGAIQVPVLGELTSGNTAQVLTQQSGHRGLLEAAVTLSFARLVTGSLPGARALGTTLHLDVSRGDLLLWSVHPEDQPLLAQLGLAGSFPKAAGGDLLGVVAQDASGNGLDSYLHKSVTDAVTFDPPTGKVSATVHISLGNAAPTSGPTGASASTNKVWLTVYSPLKLAGAVDGKQPLAFRATPELGVTAFSAYVSIPAGQSAAITLRFDGRIASPAAGYRLSLFQQPMVQAAPVSVAVSGTAGWRVDGTGRWRPAAVESTAQTFRFRHGS